MKIRCFILTVMILMLNCTHSSSPHLKQLEQTLSHFYSLENARVESLIFEVNGNHEIIQNFLGNFAMKSPTIRIYWKPGYKIRTEVIDKAGLAANIPRWLDFGFAYGLLYSTDLLPLFRKQDYIWKKMNAEFNLMAKNNVSLQSTDQNREFTLEKLVPSKVIQKIITDHDFFPLSRWGLRRIDQGNMEIESTFSENWLKLPNGKIVLSYYQHDFNDNTRLRVQQRIQYAQFQQAWLPVSINKKQRGIARGKINREDSQINFTNYRLNYAIPDSIFEFYSPGSTILDFSSPERALSTMFMAGKAANPDQVKACFSQTMQLQFDALLRAAADEITATGDIPASILAKVKQNVQQWFLGNYLQQARDWKLASIDKNSAMATLEIELKNSKNFYTGPYTLIQEKDGWKIDTNPFIIFKENE
ncbi:hypothetical protein JW964_03275 [candidate division KSB1 bacterium]|nr:hypothetical protein [candidate division KSB1 bacterium]